MNTNVLRNKNMPGYRLIVDSDILVRELLGFHTVDYGSVVDAEENLIGVTTTEHRSNESSAGNLSRR